MTSGGDERALAVTAVGMCIDDQVPLSMSDGAVHHASRVMTRDTPKPTEEMTS